MKNYALRYFDNRGNLHEIKRFEANNYPAECNAHAVASLLSGQPKYKNIHLHLVDDENQTSETYLNGYRIRKWDHDRIVWERR